MFLFHCVFCVSCERFTVSGLSLYVNYQQVLIARGVSQTFPSRIRVTLISLLAWRYQWIIREISSTEVFMMQTLLRNTVKQKYKYKVTNYMWNYVWNGLYVVAVDWWLGFKSKSCYCLTSSCRCLALCLRAVDSSSTMTGSDSPQMPGSLWSCPRGTLRWMGRCRRASFVWQGRHLPHQYLCCPINGEGEIWFRTLCMHPLSSALGSVFEPWLQAVPSC